VETDADMSAQLATIRECVGALASVCTLATLLAVHPGKVYATDEDLDQYKTWSDRLAAAAKRHDAADELLCVTTIGRRWAWALNTLPHNLIEQAARDSELARLGQSRAEMLQMLYDRRWRRNDGSEPSRWWSQLSLDLLGQNRRDEAFAVAAHITDPHVLIGLQADNRYVDIERSKFVERDILKAAQNELERRQDAARQSPRNLSQLVRVADGLMLLHRYNEILQLTDSVLHAEQGATPESPPYEDLQRQIPWILDMRARALSALGRYEEALEVLRRAVQDATGDRISHSLNLAVFLARLNRPQEALAAIPTLEDASAYGRAVAAMARVMIAVEMGDQTELNRALDDLRTHAQDYPGTRERALIVAGREDEAAAALVARFSDADLRTDALVESQDYAEHPGPRRVIEWRERLTALRNRPEVRREIAAYGRIRRYPIAGVGGF